MIYGVNGKNYYNTYDEQVQKVASNVANEMVDANKGVQFKIQDILSQVNEYTYTQEDQEAVESNLLDSLKEQFDLKEEDVYELYKRGVDLEKLNVNELSYRCSVKEQSLSKEETDKENKEQKSLEEKKEVIKKQSDSMYINALKSEGTISINSLYESCFKGEPKKGISQYKKEEVENVLTMNGLKATEGNKWAAEMLMRYDMGVSPTSISKLQNIQAAVASIDSTGGLSGDDELIKNGQVQYQPEYVDKITDELGMVTDEHIEKLVEEGKEININELRDSIHKHASEALEEHGTGEFEQNQESPSGEKGEVYKQVDEIKRQILQITTKLTVEAAQKISAKMPLESSSLQAVAEALSQMEQEMAVEALKQVNMPTTTENIAAVTDVMNVVDEIGQNFVPTVQIEVATGEKATLNEIEIALAAYEENETPVEARFGESIKIVESQIASLLENQGIEATTTNIEAAKALITNQIEVTAEGIEDIQDIVLKLNTFLEEMTPVQVATMIKEGFNPYHASVNEILGWLSDYKVEGLKTSVAEAIVSMEQSGKINEEQKEGMIGLYRIMQAVSNQKEQVMGYLFRNELPMTVENLQMAARYVRRKGTMEAVVDDSFGENISKQSPKNTASSMLERSSEASSKTLEILKMLENMELPITEENIDKVSRMSALLYPYIKEQFKKNVGKFDGMSTLPESFMEKIAVTQNVSSELVENMLKQEIPLTLSNIYWMDKMTSAPEVYGELLDDKGMLKEGLPKDLEEMEKILEEMEQEAKAQKEEATLGGRWNDYRSYKQVEEVIQFQKQRIENEGLYQIPFIIDGERRLINLYLDKDESSGEVEDDSHLKAMISYQTKNMGTVKAYLEMSGENLGFRVEAEEAQDTEILKKHTEGLIRGLQNIGYKVNYSSIDEVEKEEVVPTKDVFKHEDSHFEEII